MEGELSDKKTWCAEWFSIESFLMGINDNSRHTFKFNNVATVREMVLPNCLKNGNDRKIPGKFPPGHMAVMYLVTYSEKIELENKDGFLWPPTG